MPQVHEYDIVVCHANVIRYFALRALQLPPEAWLRLSTFNCSITYLVVRPTGGVSMRSLGDVGHLPLEMTTFSLHRGLEWRGLGIKFGCLAFEQPSRREHIWLHARTHAACNFSAKKSLKFSGRARASQPTEAGALASSASLPVPLACKARLPAVRTA
eukprot:scaffold85080_cov31-Tisochrysis_lutea.AAC.3